MKVCLECRNKISIIERIKSIFKNNGRLKCEKCKAVFERAKNSGRLIFSIGSGLAVFISSIMGLEVLPTVIESSLLRALLVGLMAGLLMTMIAMVMTYFTEYEKI